MSKGLKLGLAAIVVSVCLLLFLSQDSKGTTGSQLKLPEGFSEETVVKELGNNRHIAVNFNGDIYVRLGQLNGGSGIVVLRKSGERYQEVKRFFNKAGSGIAIRNGYLYATTDDEVYRFKMNGNGDVINPDSPERIITGLVNEGQHAAKSISVDDSGYIYVNIGAPSNACQNPDRTAGVVGQDPCPLLEKAGGIWQFRCDGKDQSYAEGKRYVTGIRNIMALCWNDQANNLYGVQHGRDQLNDLWGDQYTKEQSSELPSEEFMLLRKDADFGWPYCYYDQIQQKKVLGPEYGGDGKKEDRCAGKEKPIMGFPGHWAPNALVFYNGKQFPERYRGGAFIAFHGSWNRSGKQAGYFVVFVPFKNGKPSGNYEIFADGFKGKDVIEGSGQAKYRPCGLAVGTDGALYVSDDNEGRIWRIAYEK